MAYLFPILFALSVIFGANATNSTLNTTNEPERMLSSIERIPQFPGGDDELTKFIQSNIRYPQKTINKKIEGRVVVQFVVSKTGKVTESRIARGVSPELDKEALRIVKLLPDFIPGTMNGIKVNVWYTAAISFKLPQEKK